MSQINRILPIVWSANGKRLSLERPVIMGILNLTPDSFYDGGKYFLSEKVIVNRVNEMVIDGMTILDIGAASSRPGASIINPETEQQRLFPFFTTIRETFPDLWISVDTYHSSTAEKCLSSGADMINDISAGSIDKKLLDVVAECQCPYVLMHMIGTPFTMQKNIEYSDVVDDVISFFKKKLLTLNQMGIMQIAIDPGFGFGKELHHNYELLKHLSRIGEEIELPLITGISRKSMINKVLNTNPDESLNGTTALHMIALQNGARILRVHDVKEANQTVLLYEKFESTK